MERGKVFCEPDAASSKLYRATKFGPCTKFGPPLPPLLRTQFLPESHEPFSPPVRLVSPSTPNQELLSSVLTPGEKWKKAETKMATLNRSAYSVSCSESLLLGAIDGHNLLLLVVQAVAKPDFYCGRRRLNGNCMYQNMHNFVFPLRRPSF